MTTMRLKDYNDVVRGGDEGEAEPKTIRLVDYNSTPRNFNEPFDDGIIDIAPEKIAKWRNQGEIGPVERFLRADKWNSVPWNPKQTVESLRALRAAQRRMKDPAVLTPEGEGEIERVSGVEAAAGIFKSVRGAVERAGDDQLLLDTLESMEEERIRGVSTLSRIVDGVMFLPPFIAEFVTTGPAAATFKGSIKATAKPLLQKLSQQAAARTAVKAGTRVAAGVASGAVRTGILQHRVAGNFADRQLNEILEVTKDGRTQLVEAKEKPVTSYMKAVGDTWIEMFSEVAGGELVRGAKFITPRAVKTSLEKVFLALKKKLPTTGISARASREARQLWTKGGYDGFLAEMGEEQLGDLIRAITGVEDFGADPDSMFDRVKASIHKGDQLLVNAGVLMFPGLAKIGTGKMIDAMQTANAARGKVEPEMREITNVEAQAIADKAQAPEPEEAEEAPAPAITPEEAAAEAEAALREEVLPPELVEAAEAAGLDITPLEAILSDFQASVAEGVAPAQALKDALDAREITLPEEVQAGLLASVPAPGLEADPGFQTVLSSIKEQFEAIRPEGISSEAIEEAALSRARAIAGEARRAGISIEEAFGETARVVGGGEAEGLLQPEALEQPAKPHPSIKAAKKEFGTTDDFREAGYILPDGSMLDFSEKREGGTPGQRSQDHRAVGILFDELEPQFKALEKNAPASAALAQFVSFGNIRISVTRDQTSIHIARRPTSAQQGVIADLVKESREEDREIFLDVSGDDLIPIFSKNYPVGTFAGRIINDIDANLDPGALLQRGVDRGTTEREGESVADLQKTERLDPRKPAGVEAAAQVADLHQNRVPAQTIVTIKEAQDWLAAHGFPKIAAPANSAKIIDALLQNEAFKALSVFDQIRVAAQIERPLREFDYAPSISPKQNKKTAGLLGADQETTDLTKAVNRGQGIFVADPVVGCDHFCYECYALKGAAQAQISHQHIVKAQLKGILQKGETLRIGEKGDPSRDWAHTHTQVKALLERSNKKGHKVTAEKDVFYTTKLQNVEGFNPETQKNLQVSLDPMYPDHMWRTMENLLRIKAAHPEVMIVLRIRSFATTDPDLKDAQNAANEFANRFKLPVLETRMRFIRKSSFKLLRLDEDAYERVGNQWKLKKPLLKKEVDKFFLCDVKSKSCPACKNCIKATLKGRKDLLGPQNEATEDIAGVPLEEQTFFDPIGGKKVLFQAARPDPEFDPKAKTPPPAKKDPFPPRGFFIPSKKLMGIMPTADESTILHEPAHEYLVNYWNYIRSGKATAPYKKDWDVLAKWLDIKADQETMTVEQQEKFADGWVAFHLEGQAPSKSLRRTFERFRAWLLDVIKDAGELGIELSPAVRGVFARMLATEQEIAEAGFKETGPMSVVEVERELNKQLDLALSIRTRQEELGVGGFPGEEITRIEARIAELEEALATRKRVGEFVKPTVEPTVTQFQALKEGIRKEAKGAREAAKMTRDEIANAQRNLINLIQGSRLEPADKAKFLDSIKAMTSQEKFVGAMPTIEARIEALEDRSARRRIVSAVRKELKTIKPRTQGAVPKGRFTPLIQDTLNAMRKASKLSGLEAAEKLDKNLADNDAGATKIPGVVRALENKMLLLTSASDEMTLEQMVDVLRTIRALKQGGKELSKIKLLREEADLEEKRKIAVSIIDSRPKDRIRVTGEENADDTLWGWYNRATLWLMGWNNIMNRLSWNDKSTRTNESQLNKLADVELEETEEKRGNRLNLLKVRKMWTDAMGEMSDWEITERWAADSEKQNLGTFRLQPKEGQTEGELITLNISRAEARKRWMEFQDRGLQDTLFGTHEKSMGWTPEIKAAIEGFLTPQDKAFAQAQLDFYRDYYAGFNAVYSDINGVNLPQVENYSPIRRVVLDRKALENEMLGEIAHRRSITPSAGKQRVKNLRELGLQNDIEIIQKHIAQIEHYKAWAKKIRMFNSIFNDAAVREAITANFGKQVTAMIDRNIEDFTRGGIDRSNDWASLNIIKNNYTVSVLAGKPAIAVKQLMSFPAFADTMPTRDFMVGLGDLATDTFEKLSILENSEVMLSRGLSITPELREAVNSKEWTAFQLNPNLRNFLLLMTRWGDRGAIYIGGWPVYNYHRNTLGKTHEEAIREFEKALTSSQQSADLSQQSYFQRGSSIQRLMATFLSAPTQYFRKELSATDDYVAGRITAQDWIKTMIIYHFILPMLFQWASDGLEFRLKEQIRAGLLGSFNGVFILGGFMHSALSAALGLRAWTSGTILDSLFREGQQLIQAVDIEDLSMEMWLDVLRQGGELAGLIKGLPVKQGINVYDGMTEMKDAQSAEDFVRGFKKVAGWSDYVIKQGEKDEGAF